MRVRAHPCPVPPVVPREGGNLASLLGGRANANPTTTAHCTAAAPALTLAAYVIHTPGVRRSREGGNLASPARVGDTKRNEMEQNGTD